ncbi:polyketide synthase [Apiospora saccharicola]|uniref:Polyketide synthase n=1 Tax=Apiospora saccharicola TaxID=335842 RepID=A0ABR1W0T2_9PEZI
MRNSFIPAQASFRKLNRQIEVRPDDMMEIATSLRPWSEERKVALINNYGACGSNASMLVAQPPAPLIRREGEQLMASKARWDGSRSGSQASTGGVSRRIPTRWIPGCRNAL